MKKSISISNRFCPQTLFLYGTYKEDNTPNFGLFCWFSYYYDEGLGVMACIGEKKLTKDRIQANKVFPANLVTEEILPIADYFGNKKGYDNDKMNVEIETEKGQVLNVPVLSKSPVVFELVTSFNTGSTRVNINAQMFGNMPLPLPPKKQQDTLAFTLGGNKYFLTHI